MVGWGGGGVLLWSTSGSSGVLKHSELLGTGSLGTKRMNRH